MSATDFLPGLAPVDAGALADVEAAWLAHQEATRTLWEATAQVWERTAPAEREFVDGELALTMGCHPATAATLVAQVTLAYEAPMLLCEWSAGHLTDRHVLAACAQLHDSLTEPAHRVAVLERVLDHCRRRAAAGHGWPTPGQLRRLIRVAALLVDPEGARRRKEPADDDRGVHASPLPHGQAMLALEGPAERVGVMIEAIRARAAQAVREPGETRTRAQLEFDLAEQLLVTGTPGDSEPVELEAQVVMTIGTATGETDELGELPDLGPILPSTCRELLSRATTLRRICVDLAGRVVAVDDALPVHRDAGAIAAALEAMRSAPVTLPDLASEAYRPSARALRLVRERDRTCRFPGCTRPVRTTDVDHRIPWPRGATEPGNLQCLCRRHHRTKQSRLFPVSADRTAARSGPAPPPGPSSAPRRLRSPLGSEPQARDPALDVRRGLRPAPSPAPGSGSGHPDGAVAFVAGVGDRDSTPALG